MPIKFIGSIDEFKEKLAILSSKGSWQTVNSNQFQFRHNGGGIMNWYPSTGSITFQGKSPGKETLESQVGKILSGELDSTEAQNNSQIIPDVAVIAEEIAVTEAEDCDRSFYREFVDSELIIALVGAVGAELKSVEDILESRLSVFGYDVQKVRISTDVIPTVSAALNRSTHPSSDEYERISQMMDAGNDARRLSGDCSILALGAASWIASKRLREEGSSKPYKRRAYIINSLKHPDEVLCLRRIYPRGFYLLGVHSDVTRRHDFLVREKRIDSNQVKHLIERDENEHLKYGQRVTDTFHLSDFFVRVDNNSDKLKQSIWRFIDIIFSDPYKTPTFDEYAMFLAFAASVRSADLSRQVGAVIARDEEVLGTGANDCPRFGGGLYWPFFNEATQSIEDHPDGRDYKREEDSNKTEQHKIIEDILGRLNNDIDKDVVKSALLSSRIRDLTEFGRVVHAEMEAIISCARNNVSTRGSTLYCTTFPCHNCAKHIIASGVNRVVYVEPYAKSKAMDFHSDAITLGFSTDNNTLKFEPFVGVGPRRFIELFSMKLGSGSELVRKDDSGHTIEWSPEEAHLRLQMLPFSYLDLEVDATSQFRRALKRLGAN